MMKKEYDKIIRMPRGKSTEVILKLLSTGGVVAMAVLAPHAIQALGVFTGRRGLGSYINSVIARLIVEGKIRKVKRKGKIFFHLTDEGKNELARYRARELRINKPFRWDRRWRVIIFDIKEWSRKQRDAFRRELKVLGFIKLQNSVWVIPYECEDLIFLLKTSFKLGKNVLYLTVEKIEADKWLRNKFGLPLR